MRIKECVYCVSIRTVCTSCGHMIKTIRDIKGPLGLVQASLMPNEETEAQRNYKAKKFGQGHLASQ